MGLIYVRVSERCGITIGQGVFLFLGCNCSFQVTDSKKFWTLRMVACAMTRHQIENRGWTVRVPIFQLFYHTDLGTLNTQYLLRNTTSSCNQSNCCILYTRYYCIRQTSEDEEVLWITLYGRGILYKHTITSQAVLQRPVTLNESGFLN